MGSSGFREIEGYWGRGEEMTNLRRNIGATLVAIIVQTFAISVRPEMPWDYVAIIGFMAFFAVLTLFPVKDEQ